MARKLLRIKSDGANIPQKREEMPFLDHLEELRITIVKCVSVLFLFMILTGVFAFKINDILMWPFEVAVKNLNAESGSKKADLSQGIVTVGAPQDVDSNANLTEAIATAEKKMEQYVERPRTNSPFAPFVIYFQIIVFGAIFLSLPFILFFLAQFIMPALTNREKSVLYPGLTVAAILFLMGAAIAFFFLLPIMLGVSFRLSNALDISVLYDAASYYSTVTLVILGVGISFELPLLVFILIYVGLLKPAFLKKYRRHIFVLIMIFCALVTPPDPITLILMTLPLYLLYELAVRIGEHMLKRKQAKESDEDSDKEYDPNEDPRYKEREFKRLEQNPEDSYYMSYEEERHYYPENDPYSQSVLSGETGANEDSQNAAKTDENKVNEAEDSPKE